jgi:hypothetical protein
MKKFPNMTTWKALMFSAVLSLAQSSLCASNVLNIFAGSLMGSTGTAISPGALVQLVDLGADGVFNPIRLDDGNTSGVAQWVSGDDRLLNVPYAMNPDFPTAAAFDLVVGQDPTTGILNRVFEFSVVDVPLGTKVGLRWFPTLSAANFDFTVLAGNESYGEFTRQSSPQYGGELWRIPMSDGSNITLDALATISIGGADPNSAALASLSVIVPEPTLAGLFLVGFLVLNARRGRLHQRSIR